MDLNCEEQGARILRLITESTLIIRSAVRRKRAFKLKNEFLRDGVCVSEFGRDHFMLLRTRFDPP